MFYQLKVSVYAANPEHAKEFALQLQEMVDDTFDQRGEDKPPVGILTDVVRRSGSGSEAEGRK